MRRLGKLGGLRLRGDAEQLEGDELERRVGLRDDGAIDGGEQRLVETAEAEEAGAAPLVAARSLRRLLRRGAGCGAADARLTHGVRRGQSGCELA